MSCQLKSLYSIIFQFQQDHPTLLKINKSIRIYQLPIILVIEFERNLMQSKNLFVLVDNRSKTAQESYSELKGAPIIDFKGSAFKATEIDAEQEHQTLNLSDYSFLSQLQMKVEQLQQRIQNLQKSQVVHEKKKKRRKASQIQRNFKCQYETCGKFYGTQTSLRNHLKIKHKIQ